MLNNDFISWLKQQAPSKTGISGVGKENYTWYQQNVHFIPYTWDEEVTILRRELERAQRLEAKLLPYQTSNSCRAALISCRITPKSGSDNAIQSWEELRY